MNIIDKLKLLFKIKKSIDEIKIKAQEVKVMNGQVKPGWKTTEFWLIVITQIHTIVETLKGSIDPFLATAILAGLDCIYAILRYLAKKNG
jgi:hypothetical protein